MNKFYKIIIWVGIVMMFVGSIWLYTKHQNIVEDAFLKKKGEIVLHIQTRSTDLLKESDFDEQDVIKREQAFEDFFEKIQSQELFRIKVFNRDPVIIWSNLKEIIGQNVADNQDVQNALTQGTTIMKFKSKKPEQVTERQFKEFTETYIPIQNKKGKYVGVVEVYQTNVFTNIIIKETFRALLIKTILFGLLAYAVFIFLLWFFLVHTKSSQK